MKSLSWTTSAASASSPPVSLPQPAASSENAARPPTITPVVSLEEVRKLASTSHQTYVAPPVRNYLLDIVLATRNNDSLRLGASTRGAVALQRAAIVSAAAAGRDYVVPDDVKLLAVPVLAHRLVLSGEATFRGMHTTTVVEEITNAVPVPKGR